MDSPDHSTVHCSLDMQFNEHAVVLLPGRESYGIAYVGLYSWASLTSRRDVILLFTVYSLQSK